MGEITLELHLGFQIPESGLTINGLIGGLKESVGKMHGAILESLMKALEERLIMLDGYRIIPSAIGEMAVRASPVI